jgi:hypothetical protein
MSYGLDYSMHIHDIERLETVLMSDVNDRIAEGWKPLHVGNIHTSGFPYDDSHNSDFYVVMGVPRPKECNRHLGEIKIYYLRDNDWKCPKCLAEQD